MCSVKSPKISSITTNFVNRMMTADDSIDDDYDDNNEYIIRSSYCLAGKLVFRTQKDLGLLNEGQ